MPLICRILLLLAIGAGSARAGASPVEGAERLIDGAAPAASEEAFAREFVLRRSTAGLYSVFESTTPEREAAVYLRRGVYRRELLILFDMAESSDTPLRELVREREKGAGLRELAVKTDSDIMKLFRKAAALQTEIEAAMAAEKASGVTLSSAAVPGGEALPAPSPGGGYVP